METNAPDLRQTIGVIIRQKFLIALIVGVTTLGALGISFSQTPKYEAAAYVVSRPAIAPLAFSPLLGGSTGALGETLTIQSTARVVGSAIIAERVRTALDVPFSARQLIAAVNVTVLTDEVLRIGARASKPELARDIANAFSREYLSYDRESAFNKLNDLADDLDARVRQMETRSAELDSKFVGLSVQLEALRRKKASAQRDADVGSVTADMERVRVERNEILTRLGQMRGRQEDLRSTLTGTPGGGEILQEADLPLKPTTPVPTRDGMIGLMLGLVLGIAAAFLRHHLDDRIRTSHDIIRATGVPVVGTIPRAKWRRKREAYLATLGEPGSPAAEAYRSLRQSLTAMGIGRGLKTVMITSGSRSAGKSSTAANLAVAFAQSGQRVVVVSADLRRPRVHAFFGMSNEAGFSEVLQGDLAAVRSVVPTAVPDLSVVPSGALPRNPAALLDGPQLGDALDELRSTADVVIVDAPPISSGADSMVLAPRADVTLVVMRRDFARARGAVAAVGGLLQAGGRRIAAVLTLADEGITTRNFEYELTAVEMATNGSYPADAEIHEEANTNGHTNGHANGHEPELASVVADVVALEAKAERAPRNGRTAAKPRPRARKKQADS